MDFKGKSKRFKLLAPAKVNLRLKVVGRRPDGYHDLETVMVKLDLADEIEFEVNGLEIRIESDQPHLPVDPSNIIWRAADLVREESGKRFGLVARVRKRVPIAAGLGGGSSDAAATLKALNQLLGLEWGEKRLIDLSVRLGADVPFFLTEGAQWVEGIGERLRPIDIPPLWLILINPGFPVSTADVYRWYDERTPHPSPLPRGERGQISALTSQGAGASFPPLENDLEVVVIPRYPVLVEIKKKLSQAGALGTLMSGSGPTVFGLFESQESRDRGYEILLKEKDPNWWVCKTASV
jgi:4-diphosphocytidyl-2-C-methyl-D-erythritol kinase